MTTTVRIRLLWHKQAQFAGYLLAERLGLARRHGVEIVCEGLDFSLKHVAAVLAGATQMAVASPSHILESARPDDLRFVLAIQQESPLVYPARKADGIRQLADLSGRKVGVWPGHEDLEFRWMLARAGVSPDAVTRIEMPDTVGPFLAGDTASAQMTNYHELHVVEAALGHDGLTLFSAADVGASLLKDGLVVDRRLTERDPQVVQAVVDAVLEGWTIAFREPERAVEACVAARPDMTAGDQRRQLADIRALALRGATLTHGLGYPDPAHVTRAAEALRAVEGKAVVHHATADPRFWQAAPEAFRPRSFS
ncbi:ABC transporter substrate-binding protein [Ensifer soli]|uniref:ABC transporter substrate-binding protein n=1 Tax=Ciceribacter sp. sgz301302 TaxID=3342379 RepID=UPI0035B965EC